jgi:hypothetical protein
MVATVTRPHPLVRAGCLILAAVSAELGVWAAFFPRHFYTHFPGAGRVWVSPDGPYNQHLVRDFGHYNLAFVVLFVGAALTSYRPLRQLVLLAYLVQAIPHLVYHARHLSVYASTDKVLNMVSLGLAVLLPIVLLIVDPQLSEAKSSTTS